MLNTINTSREITKKQTVNTDKTVKQKKSTDNSIKSMRINGNKELSNSSYNSNEGNNGNLTQSEVDKLKNKTITEDGMKFHGLQVVNLGVHMPTDSFAVAPGFNPNGFASSVNEDLYNYLLNPANDQAAMNEATQLHGGNPVDTCVFFQSSALRAIGQNVPYSIGYTTHLENWMRNNGWTRHTDFQYIQRGDICFASVYHTFCFMGWKDKAKGIAYVMGNESFTEPYYRNRNLNGQSPAIYGNNSYYQATCYWTYGPGYTGQIQGINPVHGGGYNAIGTATSTATLNIQAGPNTSSSVIGQVPNGVTVPVMTTDGVWYKIYYNGVTGWIDGNYTNGLDESLGNESAPTNMPVGDNLTVTSPVGLWLTDGPSANSGNIVLLPNGTPVEALAFKDGWYKVNYEGTIGWLDAQYTSANGKDILTGNQQQNQNQSQNQSQNNSYTTKPVNGSVTILSDGLCLNKNPFPNDGTETVIPKGVTLKTSLESSNGWYKVTYKGQTGWIGGSPYSKFTPAPVQKLTYKAVNDEVKVLSDGLCLNEHPEPNDGIITVLKKGTVVHATEESSNGWFKVTYNGKTGWIGGSPYSKVISSQPVQNNNNNNSNNNNNNNNNNLGKPLGEVKVVAGGLWMNKNPEPNDGSIVILKHGTVVPYYKVSSNGWYYVSYNGKTGWIGGSPYSEIVTNQPHHTPTNHTPTNHTPKQKQQTSQPQHIPTNHTPRTIQPSGTLTINSPIGLWMNEGPNTSSAGITVIPYNTQLNYVGEENGWYEVDYNGQTGWVDGAYVNIDSTNQQEKPMNTNIVVNSPIGLWMNNKPSTVSSQIVVIPYNTQLTATAEQNGWYKVSYDGQTGWVDGAYTSQVSQEVGTVNSPVGLNMRSNAGLGSPVITLIPYNATVKVLSSENGWDEVSYNGQIGWVYGSYITM